MLIPANGDPSFQEYVNDHVKQLSDHFFPENGKWLMAEWTHFTFYIHENVKVPEYGRDGKSAAETPTSWFVKELMKCKCTYKPLCSLLLYNAEVAICLPVSNAWPERGLSAMKLVKTRLSSCLSNDMLN